MPYSVDRGLVEIGPRLITKESVAAADWHDISKKAAQVLAWIEKARQ